MQIKKPLFWDFKKQNLISKILKIFSYILILINSTKRNTSKVFGIKTICVGNIYLGGTGKTPTCIYINNTLKKYGYKTTFVKKFYQNQKDEQLLLKKYGNLICKPERINAIELAKSKKFNFAICDDGLQDKKVDYDLKIACFNSKAAIGNGLVIPAGPLREKLENLNKYHVVIINGNGENIIQLKNHLKKFNKNLKIFQGNYIVDGNIKYLKNKNFVAFSGIGNHSTFLKTLKKNKIKILKNFNFPDHYNYTDHDIAKIKKEADRLNSNIITTEKDYLRLSKKNRKKIDILKIKIKIKKKIEFTNYLKNL